MKIDLKKLDVQTSLDGEMEFINVSRIVDHIQNGKRPILE